MKRLITGCVAVMAAFGAVSAHALTYFGSRTVGPATVTFSITTDGSLGRLFDFDLVDWSVSIVDAGNNALLEGPGGLNNSFGDIGGAGLTATASDLYFNFDIGPTTLVFGSSAPGTFDRYCLTGRNSQCNGFGQALLASGREMTRFADPAQNIVARTGNVLIASVAGCPRGGCIPGVPEPANWALMIAGFGLAGGALRRRDGVRVAFA